MRWHAAALGGEVMAHRGDAVYCALVAGLPQPWAGGRPAAG